MPKGEMSEADRQLMERYSMPKERKGADRRPSDHWIDIEKKGYAEVSEYLKEVDLESPTDKIRREEDFDGYKNSSDRRGALVIAISNHIEEGTPESGKELAQACRKLFPENQLKGERILFKVLERLREHNPNIELAA